MKKKNLESKYKRFIDDTYDKKQIFLVSLNDKEVVASPTFIVDDKIDRVIGVIEGS